MDEKRFKIRITLIEYLKRGGKCQIYLKVKRKKKKKKYY